MSPLRFIVKPEAKIKIRYVVVESHFYILVLV